MSAPGLVAHASSQCAFDPTTGEIICEGNGVIPVPGDPGTDPPPGPDDPGLRYVYTSFDPGIGNCYYWSNTPGGLDAWDPANDPAVIAITTSLPLCPPGVVPPTDPEARAWQIFRSWDLADPDPSLTPAVHGITGIPTHVAVDAPAVITHDEVLPDGRPLNVRARVAVLTISWGDGAATAHDPALATGYPSGAAAHTYARKTCTAVYRAEHPSGGLCHPTLEAYPIDIAFVWTGEYDVGAGWVTLGTLATTAGTIDYDVDEARGVRLP